MNVYKALQLSLLTYAAPASSSWNVAKIKP